MEVTVKSKKLLEWQKDVLANRRRFTVLNCGRRTGKTELISDYDVAIAPAVEGYPVAFFAPEFKDIAQTWEVIKKRVEPILLKKDEQAKRLILVTGGVIEFWSLKDEGKKDSGRGRKYKLVIYEETQKIPSSVLEYHWQKVARPTLADYMGDAWFVGTPPNSKKHFFYKLICRGAVAGGVAGRDIVPPPGESNKYPDWITIRKTAFDNPHVPDSEIEAARDELPDLIYRQEFLAECVEFAQSPWVFAIQNAATQRRIFTSGLKCNFNREFVLTFDFNKNPMAAVLCQTDGAISSIKAIKEFGSNDEKVNLYFTLNQIKEYIFQQTGVKVGKWGELSHPNPFPMRVTGDATGNTSDWRDRHDLTSYEIIRDELGLSDGDIRVGKTNPFHGDSQTHLNTYIEKHPRLWVDEFGCPNLRFDLLNTQSTAERKIDKKKYDPHYLDAYRYFFEAFVPRRYDGYGRNVVEQ